MRTLAVSCLVLVACSPPEPAPPPLPEASAAHFTLECTPHGVLAYDDTRSLIPGGRVSCVAHVANLAGEPLEGVAVSFRAEAGRVRAEGTTSATGEVGAVYETALPLPRDVAPATYVENPVPDATHTGIPIAPAWMEPNHWAANPIALLSQNPPVYTRAEPRRPDPLRTTATGSRVENNPRDNLVTIIAVTDGAEAFTDTNANGTFDPGEVFVDLTEPFVDTNDDGTRDEDEPFIDTNGNRLWDGTNGVWDVSTKIWVQERILWTGVPAAEDLARTSTTVPGFLGTLGTSPSSIALTCPAGSSFCSQAGPPASVRLLVTDPWFNAITTSAASDGCAWGDASPNVNITDYSSPAQPPRLTWPAGDVYSFLVRDVRDPLTPPQDQIPPRRPPIVFGQEMRCESTAPTPGGTVARFAFYVTGTIE